MLDQRLKSLFPDTDSTIDGLGVEVVHLDANDRPVRRDVLSLDYLLSPIAPVKGERKLARG